MSDVRGGGETGAGYLVIAHQGTIRQTMQANPVLLRTGTGGEGIFAGG